MNILLLLMAVLANCQIISSVISQPKTNISTSLAMNIFQQEYILQNPQNQSYISPCLWSVSKNFSEANVIQKKSNSIMDILQYSCSDQYEITLLDNVHYEYIEINMPYNIPVTIKGGALNDNKQYIRTTMKINSSQSYVVSLIEGSLSLYNLEFNYTLGIDQNLTVQIWPESSFTISSYSSELLKFLSIDSCVFNGFPDVTVSMMVYMRNFNSVYIDDCFFQNAQVYRDSLIDCFSNQQYMEINIKNSQIINIEVNSSRYWGIVSIGLYDQFQTLIIDKCTFENCQLIGYMNISSVLYIESSQLTSKFIISNNRFTNCFGYYAGALKIRILSVNCMFSNNEFSGNGKYGLDQRGNDAYLQWISQPNEWTTESTHNRIMIMFNGSKSTNIESVSYQIPFNSGFINLPEEWAFCLTKDQLTFDCICDPDSTSYLFEICQKDKACQFDLIHQATQGCPCLPTNDPRAGVICPIFCVKEDVTQSCVCDTNSSEYSVEQCQQEKLCKYDLINQTASDCPCLSTGDPRAGGICPAYCTAKDIPNSNCVCDSGSTIYPQSTCQTEKKCTTYSDQTVPTDSCTCTSSNYPSGCKCPPNSSELTGIPSSRCECRTTGDPRANTVCPVYCIKGSLTPNCVCDTNLSSYTSSQCMKDKICIFNLSQQSKEYCPCLMKGDPRAGDVCPSYCKSKVELTIECMCELGSSYPQATCERDKLCIVDLIHQSSTICPCLVVDDPRGESACNQTEQSDPDPIDPVIPDPSEKDPEDKPDEEDMIKQEEDDQKEKQKEKSSTFQMIWISYIAEGILFIGVLVVIITFIIFRLRNKKKQIQNMNKTKEIQMKVQNSDAEEKKEHKTITIDKQQSSIDQNTQIFSSQLSQSLKLDQITQTNSLLETNNQFQSSSTSSFNVKIISQSQIKLSPQIENNKSLQQNNILNQQTSSNNSQSSQGIQAQQSLTQEQKDDKILKHEIKDGTNITNKKSIYKVPFHTNELLSKKQIAINKIMKENNRNKLNDINDVSKNIHSQPNIINNKINEKMNSTVETKQFKQIRINNQKENNQKQFRNKDNDKKNIVNINKTKKDKAEKRSKARKIISKEKINRNIDKDNQDDDEQINNNKQTNLRRSMNKRAQDDDSESSNDSLEFQSQSTSYSNDELIFKNRNEFELDKVEIINDQNTENQQDLNILPSNVNFNSYDKNKKSNAAQLEIESSLSINSESNEQLYKIRNEKLSTIYSESNSLFSHEFSNMNSSRMSDYDEEYNKTL